MATFNFARCSLKSTFFDQEKLQNIKTNLLSGFSGVTTTDSSVASSIPPENSVIRMPKNRSVYGQPKMPQPEGKTRSSTSSSVATSSWRSMESLTANDSGHGLGSNSTSSSDLRHYEPGVSDIGTSLETSEDEGDTYRNRCDSSNSNSSSGCSAQSGTLEEDEARNFMKQFVGKIFANSSAISLEEKARFGVFSRSLTGRLWFARYINKERNENKSVPESTFYSLAQYFAIVLFECVESDDFTPAKILMNMCFTYCLVRPVKNPFVMSTAERNEPENSGSNSKQYLVNILRDQPIWKSLRFWNAAFFDTVQDEREVFFDRSPKNCRYTKQDSFDDWQFQANVTFGQLGTFTHNMHSFGLPKQFCLEFLRKQATIANLPADQVRLIHDNIEHLYSN